MLCYTPRDCPYFFNQIGFSVFVLACYSMLLLLKHKLRHRFFLKRRFFAFAYTLKSADFVKNWASVSSVFSPNILALIWIYCVPFGDFCWLIGLRPTSKSALFLKMHRFSSAKIVQNANTGTKLKLKSPLFSETYWYWMSKSAYESRVVFLVENILSKQQAML